MLAALFNSCPSQNFVHRSPGAIIEYTTLPVNAKNRIHLHRKTPLTFERIIILYSVQQNQSQRSPFSSVSNPFNLYHQLHFLCISADRYSLTTSVDFPKHSANTSDCNIQSISVHARQQHHLTPICDQRPTLSSSRLESSRLSF